MIIPVVKFVSSMFILWGTRDFAITMFQYECLLFNSTDIDECADTPCDWECFNSPGSYRCTCDAGYELTSDTQCTGNQHLLDHVKELGVYEDNSKGPFTLCV